jgi:hypothetical protein
MQHLKTMSPEIVVNLQDSKLYSLTPLVMAQWYSPWDLKEGSGFKPIGVQVNALPLSFTWGLPTGCQLSLLLSSILKKNLCSVNSKLHSGLVSYHWISSYCSISAV